MDLPKPKESPLVWIEGTGVSSTGSVLVKLAQNGYFREAHKIIEVSRTASLVGRDSDGGLPEFWDIMGRRRGQHGITRLMAVCINSGPNSASRARSLIEDHNADIKEKDDEGQTALHYALGAKEDPNYDPRSICYPINAELVHMLIKADPTGVQTNDDYDNFPLHWACQNGASFELTKFLIDSYPLALQMGNGIAYTPLHLACKSQAPLEIIKLLVDAWPGGLKEKGPNWDIPLFSACLDGSSFEVIKFLIEADPNSINTMNEDGETPDSYPPDDSPAKALFTGWRPPRNY